MGLGHLSIGGRDQQTDLGLVGGQVDFRTEAVAVDARDRLARLEMRLDTFATKADLHREPHGLTWRLFGGASALVGIVYWIARTVH